MNTFTFDEHQVNICGNIYTIDFNQPKVGEASAKVQEALEGMKDSTKLTKKAIDAFRGLIDLLLGKGAFDEIFETQPITMTALTKLTMFLTSECMDEVNTYKRYDNEEIKKMLEAAQNAQKNA